MLFSSTWEIENLRVVAEAELPPVQFHFQVWCGRRWVGLCFLAMVSSVPGKTHSIRKYVGKRFLKVHGRPFELEGRGKTRYVGLKLNLAK